LILVVLVSCQNQVEPQNQQIEHFDMQQFIKTEIAELKDKNLTLKKIMQTAQKSDTLSISEPDWLNELKIFSACNINKPTLYGTYTVDTLGKTVHYQSLAKKNKVQSCLLTFKNKELKNIEKIEIENQKENFINRSFETLVYVPMHSYSIEIEQNVIAAEGSSFKILGEIESINN